MGRESLLHSDAVALFFVDEGIAGMRGEYVDGGKASLAIASCFLGKNELPLH
ncbi:hypothetical protein M6D81_19535 [Paenibacillus sp. J5C_2022]|nr:hypothetical protein [Paenibacillus sp. J5C2022]